MESNEELMISDQGIAMTQMREFLGFISWLSVIHLWTFERSMDSNKDAMVSFKGAAMTQNGEYVALF